MKFAIKKTKNGISIWDVSHFDTVAPRAPVSSQNDFSYKYLVHVFGAGLK